MPTPIDLYWSFRSPYSFIATKGIRDIEARRDVRFNLKIVLPLAVRDPDFFTAHGPEWMAYLMRDIMRLAQMTGQTIAIPNPDPITRDPATGLYAKEQPYIWRLSRLGLAATEAGQGLAFVDEVGKLIWSGQPWLEGDHMAQACQRAGCDLDTLEAVIEGKDQALDAQLAQHDQDLRAAGHWGVPTCVLAGEPFFGSDRLDVLEWRLDQMGVG